MTEGEELRKWRNDHGLSLKGLAEYMVNPKSGERPHFSLICLWETGKSPIPPWALHQIEQLDQSLDAGPGEKVKPVRKPKHNPFRDFKISRHPPTKDKFARKKEEAPVVSVVEPVPLTRALNPEPGGCLVIEFGPEAKAFLGALIKAIVVDPDDIKDPVIRGFLKFSEGR